jgi:ferredoxin-NADP reductase
MRPSGGGVAERHRFRPLTVQQVVRETADAVSLVFEVPADQADVFTYQSGQFVSLRLHPDGEPLVRSYSMSSTPGLDEDLQVTVKRVPDGRVSNWLNTEVAPGDQLEVMPPAGTFVVPESCAEVVAFAAGSGITPLFSIARSVLADDGRRVRLLYANRDRESTIFAASLDALARCHPERFDLRLHHDVDDGFVSARQVGSFVGDPAIGAFYLCGPSGFMDVVEDALHDLGIADDRIHLERFTPLDTSAPVDEPDGKSSPAGEIEVNVRMGTKAARASYRPGTTILQTARSAGFSAPSSCEIGTCATCMARVTEGRVEMRHNDALTPDEVADGWVLTCQSVPVTPSVTVVYE